MVILRRPYDNPFTLAVTRLSDCNRAEPAEKAPFRRLPGDTQQAGNRSRVIPF